MLLTYSAPPFPLGKEPGRQGLIVPILAATEQVIQQAGNSVCQRVSFEIVMKGIVPVSRFEAEFEVIVPRRPFYRSNLGTVAVLKPALALDFPR
jgi:hypothetical protein